AAAARLEAGAADLLLTAPGVAAADVRALARALGNLPAAQRVPLVVSAAASDVAARAAALRDGANDQVPWPTDTGALVALLQARAARAKG
ncbi:MAG: hypothetical protein NW201_11855, partial [Gemmatimonadales bacterium]|nr:hypothetical protein [Gemmatimonadales bacterium]